MGVQGGYEQRIEVIVKIAKKSSGGPVQGWGGGQSGCKHRIEVIVKMQKKEEKEVGWGPLWAGGGGVLFGRVGVGRSVWM